MVHDAAQEMLLVPDAQLHLNAGDLRDPPSLLDLADGDVAETDGIDEAVSRELPQRANARSQRSAGSGVCSW